MTGSHFSFTKGVAYFIHRSNAVQSRSRHSSVASLSIPLFDDSSADQHLEPRRSDWNRWSSLQQRGWTKAAAIVCERLDDDLADLIHQLGTLRREINLSPPITIVASLPSIMADLRALHDEFDEVSIDLRRRMISVTTEPIILEGVELGPFAIEWSWMAMERPSPYRVWAIEPNTATSNESATHPHVSSGRLCEGEASHSIRQALSEGRLFDFFLIVRQVLRTYNAGSAYVPIDEWYGPPCQECGTCARETLLSTADRAMSLSAMTALDRAESAVSLSAAHALIAARIARRATAPRACSPVDLAINPFAWSALMRTNSVHRAWRHQPTQRPTLRFTPTAWAKIRTLRDLGPTEVGGFGISSPDDLLLIDDIRLVHQQCGPLSVAFDDHAVADFFDEMTSRAALSNVLLGSGFTPIRENRPSPASSTRRPSSDASVIATGAS